VSDIVAPIQIPGPVLPLAEIPPELDNLLNHSGRRDGTSGTAESADLFRTIRQYERLANM
jgi:hypothetical protein